VEFTLTNGVPTRSGVGTFYASMSISDWFDKCNKQTKKRLKCPQVTVPGMYWELRGQHEGCLDRDRPPYHFWIESIL
jgi:hypothetical protein